MTSKTKALMEAMSQQILRFVEGVRQEGGVRRALFSFPDHNVVVVVVRGEDWAEMGQPISAKGPHKYEKQVEVHETCGWCGLPESHPTHGAALEPHV